MDLVALPLSPPQDRTVNNLLHDLAQEVSAEATVELLVSRILAYADEPDALLRRRKWCLAVIHTKEELTAHIRRQLKRSGVVFSPEQRFVTGRFDIETREATLWEAWFGIGSGFGSISGEDVDWGDIVEDLTFASEGEAQEYMADLDRAGTDAPYGMSKDSDGVWHIHIIHDAYE